VRYFNLNHKPVVRRWGSVSAADACVCVVYCELQSDLHQGSIWEGTSETDDPYWAALERKHSRHEGVAFGWSPTTGEHPTRSQHGHVCVSDIMDGVIKHLLVQYRGFRASPAFQGKKEERIHTRHALV